MKSVTQRIQEVKQPYGGYLNPKEFKKIELHDGRTLAPTENIHPSTAGLVVDYMTRYMSVRDVEDAFNVSIKGAAAKDLLLGENKAVKDVYGILKNISGIDNTSLQNACRAVGYDVWFRSPTALEKYGDGPKKEVIPPDDDTLNNLRTMIKRSLKFFEKFGPVVKDCFTFEPNGYTKTVDSGDGDFLTKDTLWDFKVSKSDPTNKHTLQLLMYYIMGKHSGNPIYKNIRKIGVFNPRLNTVYIYDMKRFPYHLYKDIESKVIGY